MYAIRSYYGVSIDSVHSHANWGRELGGVSFPLLSDFEPKGAVALGVAPLRWQGYTLLTP